MKIKNNTMYHLCTISPWPVIMSMNTMSMVTSMIKLINFKSKLMLMLVMMSMTMTCYQWWRDMTREGTMQAMHTKMVMKIIKTLILFITTEIMFFLSMFWGYMHMFLSPSIEIGSKWPPFCMNKIMINPMKLPLMNTIILVSLGMTLTLAHMMFYKKKYNSTMMMMMMSTLMLGMMFTSIQMYEHKQSKFTMNDSNLGSTFLLLTGFHGIHVIIGTMFITTATKRMSMSQTSNYHNMNLEMSAWYWHFVDVVWLVLFFLIYSYSF